jgi:hypothetical protein
LLHVADDPTHGHARHYAGRIILDAFLSQQRRHRL